MRQQDALFERQQRRKNYLVSYQELNNSNLQGEELLNQIEEFIKKPETPLNSLRKEQMLNALGNRNYYIEDSQALNAFKKSLCQECQPTYFNLMKVMYPLLADAYDLNAVIYGERKAGKMIGLYAKPLDEAIALAKKQTPDSYAYQLADHLEQAMNKVQHPAFFGHWG